MISVKKLRSFIKKFISIYIVLLLASMPLIGSVSGDGGVFGKSFTLIYMNENTQYAIIHHNNGIQKMLIAINFDWQESNKTAWIVPIPANADDVNIDIASGAPSFDGIDIIEEAKSELDIVSNFYLFAYLYSIALPLPFTLSIGFFAFGGSSGLGIEVHERLEKHGLTAEVISATEGEGILDYLASKGLNITKGVVPQLDDYVDKNYSFMIMWISGSEVDIRHPGIIIEFPTKKIFYPMLLTSIYDTDIIPIEIVVTKHITPELDEKIEKYSEISYFKSAEIHSYVDRYMEEEIDSPAVQNFTDEISKTWENKFTRIYIKTESNSFNKDLWFDNKVPDNVGYANTISGIINQETIFPLYLIMFLIFSMLIGFILGLLIFGNKKEEMPFYLISGFGNLYGILGLGVAIYLISRHRKYQSTNIALFFMSFILIFISTLWIFFTLLQIPL